MIARTRLPVYRVIRYWLQGALDVEIREGFDAEPSGEELGAALAWYHQNRSEIDNEIETHDVDVWQAGSAGIAHWLSGASRKAGSRQTAGQVVAGILRDTPGLRRIEERTAGNRQATLVRVWLESGDPAVDRLLERARQEVRALFPDLELDLRYDKWTPEDTFEPVLVIASDEEEEQDAEACHAWEALARKRLSEAAGTDEP